MQHNSDGQDGFIRNVIDEIEKVIVGQRYLVERLLVAILGNGHLLIEGVPGLAKTTTVKALAQTISAKFQRIQFTPDLLPADLTGTLIFNPADSGFRTRKGPIFANIILADEINRAPAKVQSALLEAMEERQVTIGDETFPLEDPFLVLATQNPIEQEGTYPLPEAQLDRFMMKISLTYPTMEEEGLILRRVGFAGRKIGADPVITPETLKSARSAVDSLHVDRKIDKYILDIVFATRFPDRFGLNDLKPRIQYGASPRGSIYLAVASRAYAFIRGRTYVVPQDVKSVAADVLRHRIILTYEAEAEGVSTDDIIAKILSEIEVP